MADRFIAPTPPSSMTHIPLLSSPSVHLLGNDTCLGGNFHLTSIFHRQLTSLDDFILGVLSVIIISLLSDILYCILLRTTSNDHRITLTGLVSAFLLTELSHLRSFYHHFKLTSSRAPPNSAAAAAMAQSALLRHARTFSISVIFLGFLLFATDVLVVVFTQPSIVRSLHSQYTLESHIPVSTDPDLGKAIYTTLLNRPCITPVMPDALQRRNYNIVYCALLMNGTEESVDQADRITNSSIIRIDSWLHEGGADHNISFAGGFINIKVRAQILMAKEDGGARRLIFVVDNDKKSNASIHYLHDLTMYTAKRLVCSSSSDSSPQWCSNEAQHVVKPIQVDFPVAEVQLWSMGPSENNTKFNMSGVRSTFFADFSSPAETMYASMYPLVASAAIVERKSVGHSTFTRVANNSDYQDGAVGLLEEDQRQIGVALLGLLCAILAIVSVTLRLKLRPVSLGLVAISDIIHVDKNGVRLASTSSMSEPMRSEDGILNSEPTSMDASNSHVSNFRSTYEGPNSGRQWEAPGASQDALVRHYEDDAEPSFSTNTARVVQP